MVRRTVVAVTAGVVVVVAAGTAIALVAGRGAGSPVAAGPSTTDGPTSTTATATTTAPPTSSPSAASTSVSAGPTTRPATRSVGPATSAAPGPSTPSLASTDVSVTYAGWDRAAEQVQVNAFMPVLENGGTCTLTVADAAGADQRTATAPASADATTTICDQLTIDSATMAAGTWSATVTYSSATHQGRSAASDVVVAR